jgi:predicted TIM-barrel fold metal-dependent hydrolase
MLRREFLGTLAGAGALPLVGCRTIPSVPAFSDAVDAHCHVFNASDLPAVRFIRRVFLGDHSEVKGIQALEVRDPDLLDGLLNLFLRILGANRAPTAKDEIAVLDRRAAARAGNASEVAAGRLAVGAVADYLEERLGPTITLDAPSAEGLRDRKLVVAILDAARQGTSLKSQGSVEIRALAAAAYFSLTPIGTYLRWFTLFTLYRNTLVDRLAADAGVQGLRPLLLAPATVDFDRWLGENVKGSPLGDQIAVMDRISRRGKGPAVHAYFGFDPLREVYFRSAADGERLSPLLLARTALEEHGFLGVKLYPPMGFRPSGNSLPYPQQVRNDLGRDPSRDLDRVLDDLYRLCLQFDAPVLAHAYPSNEASGGFGERADPAYWMPVLREYPRLRLCLAHFGRFDAISRDRLSESFPEASWEWTFGRYIKDNPGADVVADLSFFDEALDPGSPDRARIAGSLRRFVAEFDPGLRHLVYGSDWIMLGMHSDYMKYAESVDRFLADDCRFDPAMRARFFHENATRFMGLERGGRTKVRLAAYYERHGLPSRLPQA